MSPDSKTFQGFELLKRRGFVPNSILDVGAYNGDWSRGIRTIYPDAYILMIDALAEKEPGLRHVCEELGNADYVISLMGEEDRPDIGFHVVKGGAAGDVRTGSSKYKENTPYPTELRQVQQRCLNTILKGVDRSFQLLKLDIQGAELETLRGASRHLHRIEAVLMEVSTLQYNANAPLFADVIPAMDRLGFVLFELLDEWRHHSGCLLQVDALFVRPDAAFRPQPPF